MPRKRPEVRAREHYTLSVSTTRGMADEFQNEAGPAYGAQAALWRKVWNHWKDGRDLRAELDRERAARIRVEQALRKVQVAVHDL